jgi:hypothetical protein
VFGSVRRCRLLRGKDSLGQRGMQQLQVVQQPLVVAIVHQLEQNACLRVSCGGADGLKSRSNTPATYVLACGEQGGGGLTKLVNGEPLEAALLGHRRGDIEDHLAVSDGVAGPVLDVVVQHDLPST